MSSKYEDWLRKDREAQRQRDIARYATETKRNYGWDINATDDGKGGPRIERGAAQPILTNELAKQGYAWTRSGGGTPQKRSPYFGSKGRKLEQSNEPEYEWTLSRIGGGQPAAQPAEQPKQSTQPDKFTPSADLAKLQQENQQAREDAASRAQAWREEDSKSGFTGGGLGLPQQVDPTARARQLAGRYAESEERWTDQIRREAMESAMTIGEAAKDSFRRIDPQVFAQLPKQQSWGDIKKMLNEARFMIG
jgi:hypothetical protein